MFNFAIYLRNLWMAEGRVRGGSGGEGCEVQAGARRGWPC